MPVPEYETIVAAKGGGIGRLTLNRPDSLNPFNEKMTEEIHSVLKEFSGDGSVRCVSITGAGRAFSAGQDLNEIAPGRSFADSLRRRYNPMIKMIVSMEKPVVALINGVAAGAGMSLALACDYRIMASGAKLIQAFVRIGLVPDSASTFFLPRLAGYAKAFELAALGNEITADEALRIGIVNRVVADADFQHESEKILERFAAGPTRAYSLIKKLLIRSSRSSLEESLEYETLAQEIAGRTEDSREAIKSFIEKRTPVFKGK